MLLKLHETLVANLRGEIHPNERAFVPREVAYARLVQYSGCDFGDDAEAWARWLSEPRSLKTFHEGYRKDARRLADELESVPDADSGDE